MDLNEQGLRNRLGGRTIGSALHFFPVVGSTNDEAFGLALKGAPEGTVVVADAQHGGKGRLKRRWSSPSGCNLYTSIVLRPPLIPAAAAQITLVAGVALAESLARLCPAGVALKWPNDILIRNRKVCGILTEMKVAGSAIDFIVVGIGVNINMSGDDFDEALRPTATSLMMETGRPLSRLECAVGMYDALERCYGRFIREGFAPLRDAWLGYAAWLGKPVRVVLGDEVLEGEMAGLDSDGALLLSGANGTVTRVLAGDASLREG